MKLRNKKTGEILDGICIHICSFDVDGNECKEIDTETRSLEKVLEVWEDYKPVEPIIGDPKIRKVVRAWAEINGFDKVTYEYDVEFAISSFSVGYVTICFFDCFSLLENGKEYTITELCGGEEE